MPRLLTSLPMIALLAFAQTASAQTATTTTTEPAATDTQPAAEATAPVGSDLTLGQEETPQIAAPYVREEFGDWKLQCFKVTEGEEPCQLYQLLKDQQGTDVAEVALFRLPSGGQAIAGATITVPLETLLTAQLTIAVDGGKGKRYPFSFCSPVGCYARIGLTDQDVASFKKGATATITLVPAPAPDQKVVLNMSLSGFTNGFGAASVLEN